MRHVIECLLDIGDEDDFARTGRVAVGKRRQGVEAVFVKTAADTAGQEDFLHHGLDDHQCGL